MLDIQPYKNLPFAGVVLPEIIFDKQEKLNIGAKENCSNLEFITQLCRYGFKQKISSIIPKEKQQEYIDRIKLELDTIENLGFTNYILMVWDICKYGDFRKIPRGPGRGSVSSSLICYLIGITTVDPIKYGLFFTRFLSKARAKYKIIDGIKYVDGALAPDIDMDFDYHRRQEIIEYLNIKYQGKTSKLLTTTTFTSKILIKDVLKTYENAPEERANEASDLIEKEHGIPVEIEDALFNEDAEKINKQLKEWAEDHKETIDIAMGLSGLNRAEGQHASAILICNDKINELMPLQYSSDKETVSGYDMYSSQEIVLKFDILGLKTLSVIDDVCRLAGIKESEIDINDKSIYDFLQNFTNRYGIFQFETFAQGSAAAKIKPKNFDEIAATLAIARPGAFAYLQQYCDYLHHGKYTSIHPLIDDILKPTGGVCIYQEQYLAMLIRIGMNPDDAEGARKVLGKKLKDKVPEVIAKIEEICKQNNHPKEIVDVLVKIAYDSGGYQFAKAHSIAYAMITAQTIYLKVHYPLQFYWALLKMTRNESDSHQIISVIEKELRSQGYNLLPPHLIHSSLDFKIVDNNIRFALGMIKGISEKNMQKLESFRNTQSTNKFEIFQSLRNSGLNIGIGSALIQAGCMEGYGKSRSRLVLELQTWNLLTDKEKTLCLTIGENPTVSWDVLNAVLFLKNNFNEKGKPLIKESRFGTIKKKYEEYKKIYEINRSNEHLANFWYERKILGYSYSENLRGIFSEYIDRLDSIENVKKMDGKYVRIIGFAADCYKSKTKAGNNAFKLQLSDETGEISVKIFNEKINRVEEINGRLPEEDDLCIIEGKKMEGETIFADKIGIQTAKIYLKLSELKDTKSKSCENTITNEGT